MLWRLFKSQIPIPDKSGHLALLAAGLTDLEAPVPPNTQRPTLQLARSDTRCRPHLVAVLTLSGACARPQEAPPPPAQPSSTEIVGMGALSKLAALVVTYPSQVPLDSHLLADCPNSTWVRQHRKGAPAPSHPG